MTAYQIRSHGLGIIITQLSFILATGTPAIAVVPIADHMAYDLKRIFQWNNDRLIIQQGSHGWPDLETDELCTYAPYFTSDQLTLFGRQYSTQRKKKNCVALVMHHDGGLYDPTGQYGMPYNKFATVQDYNLIFQRLTNIGYDVITMNQTTIDLERKIYLLNELCEFVIGYEGGIGHLAHVLGIPFFCLPWRLNDMGHPGIQPGLWFEAQRFHADKRTWFLKDTSEFVGWSKTDLTAMVDRLYNNQGNNILFDPGTRIYIDTLKITAADNRDLTPRIMWCQTRGKYTTAFIKEHLPIENMVKYPQKSVTYST